jgi:hypothetical protein
MYIDGDADFYQPEVNPLGGAASASDLAFATGRGPDEVTHIEGRRPLVRDDDVVVFACRDADDRDLSTASFTPASRAVRMCAEGRSRRAGSELISGAVPVRGAAANSSGRSTSISGQRSNLRVSGWLMMLTPRMLAGRDEPRGLLGAGQAEVVISHNGWPSRTASVGLRPPARNHALECAAN